MFGIVQYFLVNFLLSFFVSLFLNSFIFCCYIGLKNQSKNKKIEAKKNLENVELYAINFQVYNKKERLNILSQLLPSNIKFEIKDDYLIYNKNNKKYILISENNIEKYNVNNILNTLNNYPNYDNYIVFCNIYEKETENFIKSLKTCKILLINKYDFYNLCKEKDLKIPLKLELKTEKYTLKSVLKYFFIPKHFRGFFTTGILLIFTGLILPFKSYYLIAGSICLIFSLICKFSKNNKLKHNWYD